MAESALMVSQKLLHWRSFVRAGYCARQNVKVHLSISFCAPVRVSGQMSAKPFTRKEERISSQSCILP